MEAVETQQGPKKPGIAGSILWLAAAGIVMFAYGAARSDLSLDLPYVIGECMGGAFMAWLLFHFIVARRRGGGYSGLSFLVILATLTAGTMLAVSQQRIEASRMAAGLRKDLSAITSSLNAPGAPQPLVNINSAPAAKGDLGEVERFIRAALNKMASQRNDYLRGIEKIGWARILDPERIAKDAKLDESKAMVRKAKELVAAYRGTALATMDGMRAEIGTLAVSDSTRQGALRGFDRSIEKSKGRLVETIDLEAKTVDEFGRIFDLLSEAKGHWTVRDGKILFARQEDLSRFNVHLAAMKTMTLRQEALQKEGVDAAASNLEKLAK